MRRVFPFRAARLTQFHTPGTKTSHTCASWRHTVGSIQTRRNPMRRPRVRSLAGGAAGIAAGLIGGVVLTSVSAAGPTPMPDVPPLIDATHVPPALTVRGEPITLRYGLICTPRADGLP